MKKPANDIGKLLFRKELRLLAGVGYRNFITLFAIAFLSLFAVSVAWNSFGFLEDRMSNPYTNLLNIPKQDAYEDIWENNIQAFLFDKEKTAQLGIESVSKSYRSTLRVFKKDCRYSNVIQGQTYTPEEDASILSVILESDKIDTCNFDRGIILSESGLEALGYNWTDRDNVSVVYMKRELPYPANTYVTIPVQVIKSVAQLPHRADFIIHPKLDARLWYSFGDTDFFNANQGYSGFQLVVDKATISDNEAFLSDIKNLTGINSATVVDNRLNAGQQLLDVRLESKDGFRARFSFFQDHIAKIDSTVNLIFVPQPSEFYWNADFEIQPSSLNLVVNFKELGKIRLFADTMKSMFDYPVDLTSVETKENFKLTSLTTKLLVFCLVAFSLAAVLIFVSSMFKSHLKHISRNIGTIIAFGYRPNYLLNIYLSINAFLTLSVLTMSLVLLFLAKPVIGPALRAFIYEGATAKNELIYNPINSWTLLTCALVFIGALLVTWSACRRILAKAPGDLIYQRID